MRKEMISELCRFYQGEEKCPFEGDALKLWNIERIYFEALRDADKLSLDIAVLFKAEVIDAIGRYYPSEKDELIARYNGSLREIIASVGSGWAEAEKDAQNRLSAIRGKIASMPRKVAESFLSDEIKDHSNFSDSLLGQSYENSGCWVTFDKPSWVLREIIEYHYWRIQDAMDRYFVQDQSDIIKDEVSRFLIHILMRDGLREVYSEVIQGEKPKSPRVSGIDGEAASVKTELIPECLRTDEAKKIFDEAKHWFLITEDYKWNIEGGFTGGDCAYFCANVSRELNLMKGQERGDRQPIKWEAFDFFGYKRSNLSNYINHYENGLSRPRNASIIDQVVPCHIKVKEKFTHKKIR